MDIDCNPTRRVHTTPDVHPALGVGDEVRVEASLLDEPGQVVVVVRLRARAGGPGHVAPVSGGEGQ